MQMTHLFKPGMAFGEIALMTNSSRTGTVVCNENCTLMTLDQAGFQKMMGVSFPYVCEAS